MDITKEKIAAAFQLLQEDICNQLEVADGKGTFKEDLWEREGGGGGRSRVIENGGLIEKGGVNFSEVFGPTPDKILKGLNIEQADFYATGVSIVLHPENPWIPIIHMNVRYFEMSNGTWWFGGGIDLTPHYIDVQQAKFFHQVLFDICHKYDPLFYEEYKKWADDYFYIRHRQETRGIGGIFFDRLHTKNTGLEKSTLFDFVSDVGNAFAPTYTHLMHLNKDTHITDQNKAWQALRRGRYVEFNLVWDKGTKFGLDTSGRTESILMSMPPIASWQYNHTPEPGSEEEKTLSMLKRDINWLDKKI